LPPFDESDEEEIQGFEVSQALKDPYIYGSNIYHSPLIVSEIQNAIKLSKDIKANSTSDFIGLPLELRIMITELVCPVDSQESDVQNTFNMLLAFGWILPKSFWELRSRVNERWRYRLRIDERRLLLELNSPNISSATWQSICLVLMPLLRDQEKFVSSGLANRERVMFLIDGILKKMKKSSC